MFLANLLIALREGVEASLIVGIIVAYITKVGRRDILPKLWIGVVLAAVIPLGLGVYWTWGSFTITFQEQEILGGGLSIVAALMVTWMIFWMGKNSRKMTQKIKEKSEAALESGNTWGLIWMAIISVCREGAETAVFVWGTVKSSGDTGVAAPALGVGAGLILAIIIGYLIYKGSVAINLHKFFAITGYLLILVAAGIVLYGIGDLQEASVFSGWGICLYDKSALITDVAGQWWFVLLNAFFNVKYWFYPTHLQFICWIAYLVIVLVLFTLQIKGIIFTDKGTKKKIQAGEDVHADEMAPDLEKMTEELIEGNGDDPGAQEAVSGQA